MTPLLYKIHIHLKMTNYIITLISMEFNKMVTQTIILDIFYSIFIQEIRKLEILINYKLKVFAVARKL